ncbi:MAG: glycosyltransferase, partial [Bacteroidota bacterium]
MAKILLLTSGLTGILNASFAVAHRLQKVGHEVVLAAPRAVGKRVEQEGLSFHQLPDIPQHPLPRKSRSGKKIGKLGRLFDGYIKQKKRQKKALQNLRPTTFINWAKREAPDLLLLDVELHEYIIATHAQKWPFLLLSQWFSLWHQPGLPYLLHDTIPGVGEAGTPKAIEKSWKKIKRQRQNIFARKRFLSGGTDRRSTLLAYAKEQGFPMKYIGENWWPGPYTYDELPVLSMTAMEMEFPHDPRPNLHYIGPMVHAQRQEASVKSIRGIALDDIFTRREATRAKLIYCSVSTLSTGDHHFIRKLIRAVANRPDWLLIFSTGGHLNTQHFGQLPSNTFAFSYAPQLRILKEADLSINHGGIHTIHECLHFKVAMLVYSGQASDQNGCAARVAFHELGIMANKNVDSPEDIQNKINSVL